MGLLLAIPHVALAIVQIAAFFQGMEVWFGFGTIGCIVGFVAALVLGGPGTVAMTVIGFYGMMYGWGWQWWWAALVSCPFLILSVAMLGAGGVASLFRRKPRPAF